MKFNIKFTGTDEEQIFTGECCAVPRIGERVEYTYSPIEKRELKMDVIGKTYRVKDVIHLLHGTNAHRDWQDILCVLEEVQS